MVSAIKPRGLRIAIDRGGTFTDCICEVPDGKDIVIKILSVDPSNYADAPTEAIRQVLQIHTGKDIPRGTKLDTSCVEWIRMGTTVATNALLERKGEATALLITEGFRDLLTIGNQSRPAMFDMAINRPEVLYSAVEEVSERVTVKQCSDSQLRSQVWAHPQPLKVVKGISDEEICVIKSIDPEAVTSTLQKLYDNGFRSLAVCLMHSYTFPDHEKVISDIAKRIGFEHISLSSEVSQRSKIVPRGNSSVIDAYLTPAIDLYLSKFLSSFPDIAESGVRLDFMQSDGGLVASSNLSGLRSILSGPAGGVVGYAKTCYDEDEATPVIGFDMGGTSTDVSRYAGSLEHIFESNTAGIPVQAPQLDISTIAAGGGSILQWRDGLMCVGPESASSHPGPASYRKGGPLTVTDANLALGRLIPERFPAVFGPNENEPLDREVVLRKFTELAETISRDTGKQTTWDEVAAGFIQVANSAMCQPIRSLTEARGRETSAHDLASFGGAGGQHACAIAQTLGIGRVLIHRYSSLLSAYGIGLADVVNEARRPYSRTYPKGSIESLNEDLSKVEAEAESVLVKDGFLGAIDSVHFLSMRYDGSDTAIMITKEPGKDALKSFIDAHHQEFGFTPENRDVFIDEIRVRAIGRGEAGSQSSWLKERQSIKEYSAAPKSALQRDVYFAPTGWQSTPVYNLDSLSAACKITGPALIVDKTQTILVSPEAVASILSNVVVLDVKPIENENISSSAIDPVHLSVFRHRFFGVAEQMGRTLQKVSVSANIKERLDFSCAIFTPEGDLVANAPHVPAMIGSMAFAVKSQITKWEGKLQDGDVLLSNSPEFGGTHLPDFTVITPVFDQAGKEIIFWTASRGHHADVGGILPGSMPPSSVELWEEGAVFESFLLVRGGVFDEPGLEHKLMIEPLKNPGCSGSRCFQDNMTDLKAQVAANHCGIRLVRQLIQEYSMDVVQMYMRAIQDSAELAIRNLFKRTAKSNGSSKLSAVDYMDDGTPMCLEVTIDGEDGSAIFDFTGTGAEVWGNWNAPIAICSSGVIYALRCMVNSDIPLNHGCIRPVKIITEKGSLLNPSPNAAVCAGNVLTSQRIVDVIFKAFGACAASQGCMNNFTFGIDGENGFGYYETICGGSGAGPTWEGTSGVHTNMTNTRITDPESLERRYPVLLRQFSLRPNSGGDGKFRGGDGIIRDVEFRTPMTASILSERRSFQPYGMAGGEGGKRGENFVLRADGRKANIGGKKSVKVGAGDRVQICTPGGGGYGKSDGEVKRIEQKLIKSFAPLAGGSIEMTRALAEQV